MATWDAAYLLKMFNRKAGRLASGDSMSDADKYEYLSEAQNRVIAQMMPVVPYSLYPKVAYASMPTLTNVSGLGQVFTFGNDSNGYANFPLGHGGIYPSLNDIPNNPWVEGRDYISEGTQIRIPNNGSYGGTLYVYAIMQPADIDATHQPSLFPEASRDLIVIEAVRTYAKDVARNEALRQGEQDEWDRAWPIWCATWKTQFRQGGALNVWTGMQLAMAGGYQGQWAT